MPLAWSSDQVRVFVWEYIICNHAAIMFVCRLLYDDIRNVKSRPIGPCHDLFMYMHVYMYIHMYVQAMYVYLRVCASTAI